MQATDTFVAVLTDGETINTERVVDEIEFARLNEESDNASDGTWCWVRKDENATDKELPCG